MAIMAMATALHNNIAFILFVLFILPATSFAGQSTFTPEITVDETFSDNVNLSAEDKTASLVSQWGVGLNEKYLARNAAFNIGLHSVYAMYSHDSSINDVYTTGDVNGYLMLWPDGLSLIGSASLSNVAANGASNSLANIVSADTVQKLSYSTGLAYQTANSDHTLNGAINFTETQTEDNIGESHGYNASIDSESGNAARQIFWDAQIFHSSFSNKNIERSSILSEIKLGYISDYKLNPFLRFYNEDYEGSFDGNNSIGTNSYGAGIRWLITPRLYLDLSYNIPTDKAQEGNATQTDDYYDASLRWQPTVRTVLNASFSQRFYGNSYNLDLTHRNRRLTNTITYSESVEVFTRENYQYQEAGLFFCPNADNLSPIDCALSEGQNINIENSQLQPLTEYVPVEDNAFSLNKRLAWSSSLALSRTTFTLKINGNKRESLETHQKDENMMSSLAMKRALSPRSSLTLEASYTKRNTNITDTVNSQFDHYKKYNMDYEKDINSRLSFLAGISQLNRESTTQRYSYDERRIYFQLTKGF